MSDTDLPFVAHHKVDDKLVPRRFATNAEAHAFRATLVGGKLPPDPVKEQPKAEVAPTAPVATAPAIAPQKVDAPKPAVTA